MSTDNPYAFESMSSFVGPVQGSPTEAINRSIQALVETRPWVRLMGVFAAIGAVLCGLRCLLAAPSVLSRLVGMMNGIDWLFAEPFPNDLASIAMRLRIGHSSHGKE